MALRHVGTRQTEQCIGSGAHADFLRLDLHDESLQQFVDSEVEARRAIGLQDGAQRPHRSPDVVTDGRFVQPAAVVRHQVVHADHRILGACHRNDTLSCVDGRSSGSRRSDERADGPRAASGTRRRRSSPSTGSGPSRGALDDADIVRQHAQVIEPQWRQDRLADQRCLPARAGENRTRENVSRCRSDG